MLYRNRILLVGNKVSCNIETVLDKDRVIREANVVRVKKRNENIDCETTTVLPKLVQLYFFWYNINHQKYNGTLITHFVQS